MTENELNKIPPYSEAYKAWLNSGKQSEHLLSDQQCQEAIKWSTDKTLNEQEREFLRLSHIEQEKQKNIVRQQAVSRQSERMLSSVFEEEQRRLLITAILNWTEYQPELTEIISNLVIENKDTLEEGKEQELIEQIIQKYIIENWQSNQASEHLTKIKGAILETDGNIEERLKIYKDILQVRVLADNNPEKIALVQSQVVINKNNYLQVANRIYQAVFSIQWVNQQLEELIDNESNPQPFTVTTSFIVFIAFIIGTILFIGSKIKSPDSTLPNNIPEICVKPIDNNSLDSQLETLKDLEQDLGDNFPLECQQKLVQLEQERSNPPVELNQQEIVNRDLYNKALEEGANNRVRDGVISLCQIKEIPKDIEYARDKLQDWFNDSYWKDDVIKSLQQIDNCPSADGTALEQYLQKGENE